MVHKTAHIADDDGLLIPVAEEDAVFGTSTDATIRSSPYFEHEHLLDLTRLEAEYRILALALSTFQPVSEQYAHDAYAQAFNFNKVIELVRHYSIKHGIRFNETTVYIVAFRSSLKDEVKASSEKRSFLAKVDKDSHTEANTSGGLLKYWFGIPDNVHARNLATCLWRSQEDAKLGGGGNAHRQGMRAVKSWFAHWEVERYELTVSTGAAAYSIVRITE